MAAGQKFNNLMPYVTLRAAGVTDFDHLPIPYRAVATDLESGSTLDLFPEFYQPLDARGYFFIAPNAEYQSELQDVYDGKEHVAQYEVDTSDLRYGGSFGLGADTSIGPMYIGYGHADEGFGSFYFSLGTAF